MTKPDRRGLLVDLDGTLANTLSLLRQTYETFLEGFGLRGTAAEFEHINGPPIPEIVRILRDAAKPGRGPGRTCPALLRNPRRGSPVCGSNAGSSPSPQRAQGLGWIVAIVTSGLHRAASAWLNEQGFDEFISEVVGGDDVKRSKPDPEHYVTAVRLIGCKPEDSIAIEDSCQGAKAAIGAGLRTLIVGNSVPSSLAGSQLLLGALPSLLRGTSLPGVLNPKRARHGPPGRPGSASGRTVSSVTGAPDVDRDRASMPDTA